MTIEDWCAPIREPQLCRDVPAEIRDMFEIARGAMLQGPAFHPLYTLALEQVYRVADAAMRSRSLAIGVPPSPMASFSTRIHAFADAGRLSLADHRAWEVICTLRNSRSHPTEPSVLSFGIAVEMLRSITKLINGLFATPEGSSVETHRASKRHIGRLSALVRRKVETRIWKYS